ncbi:DNA-directed RNA polymerase I largest subunit [Spraguea lophii 42_110]|uniref:DNA-directed RNA polymerase subunit n=1 Tax=Spraguea lophii (strain 42_110) TaxID=1358809 RepID=S7XUC7_SPRLO|nr:DNA-directed RNA polymerase I largest subunit [Spraguea lophii 42_110]
MSLIFSPENVSFDFYKNDDIEKISVAEIKSILAFDSFGHPLPDGLYDLRMGPLSPEKSCETCKLSYFNCQGHFGRINLGVYVYNPLCFAQLYKLIRASCIKCNRFNATDEQKIFIQKDLLAIKYTEESKINADNLQIHHNLTNEFFKGCHTRKICIHCKTRYPKYIKGRNLRILKEIDGTPMFIRPDELVENLKGLFETEVELCHAIFGTNDHLMFFVKNIIVQPNKFRPVSYNDGKLYENNRNMILTSIIKETIKVQREASDENIGNLQRLVYFYFDSSKNENKNIPGMKQILEKKEGLFRQNMMGKRVNYAARSVISPDPNLEPREVGVPQIFAETLTFPEQVTPYNLEKLRQLVLNGSKYPGCVYIEENGVLRNIKFISDKDRIIAANQLLQGNKRVWRHLQNGDFVLLNRQPTLHKPSIMGHIVRVLPEEKTIRFNYANCSSYNADFDGDEMNIHFVQSHISRAEVQNVCLNDNNYLVSTDGNPIRGLIQDYIVVCSRMTLKNTFYSEEQYKAIVNNGLSCGIGTDRLKKLLKRKIILEKPCIKTPVKIYSGKQIISTILKNLGLKINIKEVNRLNKQLINEYEDERIVQIVDGTLVSGVLDKSQIGPSAFGLVHACGEVYGYEVCNDLFTVFGRILNKEIMYNGFTTGIDDLLLDQEAEKERNRIILEGIEEGKNIARKQMTDMYFRDQEKVKEIDMMTMRKMNEVTTKILNNSLVTGQKKKYPNNGMGLIINSGARGSIVNLSQISALLGQQELEGRRVPLMISGASLPCFKPYDPNPITGGFIFHRFLTGLQPAEYFFHCMAGREGLMDTAVKTHVSGYLQRSLIKHLESLKVEYDHTVRSDKRVISFKYGEDGLDPRKEKYLKRMDFLEDNKKEIANGQDVDIYSYKKERAYIEPGEPVGIIAAQSIGEPSTQMTLNTFHLAGVGGGNVTLGMPRLKEIVMVASKEIKNPYVKVNINENFLNNKDFIKLEKVMLSECIEQFKITQNIVRVDGLSKEIKIDFYAKTEIKRVMKVIKRKLLKKLIEESNKLNKSKSVIAVSAKKEETREMEIKEEKIESSVEDSSSDNEELNKDDSSTNNPDLEEIEEEIIVDDILEMPSRIDTTEKVTLKDNIITITLYTPVETELPFYQILEQLVAETKIEEHGGISATSIEKDNIILYGGKLDDLFFKLDTPIPLTFDQCIDIYSAYTNDIYKTLTILGVEAARNVIVEEINGVFSVYGIKINKRHIILIADYMTRDGGFSAFSRTGMLSTGSALQKISFESCFSRLRESAIFHDIDFLENPSARIILGQPIKHGTGSFELIHKYDE